MEVDGSPDGVMRHVLLHLPLSRMGSRHGQICFYDVGFDEMGKVLALKANFYNDGMSRG
jgi:xanthine dehydrogenase molybdopterin-binding subunit B